MNMQARIPLDCFIDIVPASARIGAPVYGLAAMFFDPTGFEPVPDYDPHNIAANVPNHGHAMAFFAPISIESNRGLGLSANITEKMHWDDLIKAEIGLDLVGRSAPDPYALRDVFAWLHYFLISGPGMSRPVRFWMTRPDRYLPVMNEAFNRTRNIATPWGDHPEIDSLFTLNRVTYGRGQEGVYHGKGRHIPDPYHPLRACIEGARQVQTALRDLKEYGPAELID